MKRIGIIGGVGSGKSQVADLLANHFNAYVIKADNVSHELIKKGNISYQLILDYFGKDILDASGEIDRSKLGDIVFKDRSKLERLNHFIHPYVYDKIQEDVKKIQEQTTYQLIAMEVPLLIEAGFEELVDEIWFVYANLSTRTNRLKEHRQYSQDKIDQIIQNQLQDETYKQHATYVIDNSFTIEKTLEQIKRLLT